MKAPKKPIIKRCKLVQFWMYDDEYQQLRELAGSRLLDKSKTLRALIVEAHAREVSERKKLKGGYNPPPENSQRPEKPPPAPPPKK